MACPPGTTNALHLQRSNPSGALRNSIAATHLRRKVTSAWLQGLAARRRVGATKRGPRDPRIVRDSTGRGRDPDRLAALF